jgi:RNA polymerase sigma factor (TIGR02999 family)
MNEVTRILDAIGQGDPQAPDQLLPLVYDELRQLAAQKLVREGPGLTLQPTALVHEAYLRLVGEGEEPHWDNRAHFFGAAAEAMRRILVERARRLRRRRHGGGRRRVDLQEDAGPVESPAERLALDEDVLALDAALPRLAEEDAEAAQVVRLHFFAGLPIEQVGEVLGVSRATAYRHWAYARVWLRDAMGAGDEGLA